MRCILSFVAIFVLAACSPHNPMGFQKVQGTPTAAGASETLAPHQRPVWISEGGLPPGVDFVLVEVIDAAALGGYGDVMNIDKRIADRARAIGADAVINVKRWRQPSAFSWAAPHGRGEAVKIKNSGETNLEALPGRWL